jgi:hypothetical protein
MARRGFLVGLTMALLAAVPGAALAAKPDDPFRGSYQSIDFDGSNQLLAFGGPDAPSGPSNVRRVIYLDDNATLACGGGRFFAEGVGFVDGDSIVVFFEVYCGNAGTFIGDDVIVFTADPAAGTLSDTYDVVWTRP